MHGGEVADRFVGVVRLARQVGRRRPAIFIIPVMPLDYPPRSASVARAVIQRGSAYSRHS